ncbi:MAG TPA: hypothetical protein GX399_14070 [Xanthomonadaceae bacterium]|nr:hypothetical protein [Xanthomonadaceae bacterium]
MLGKIRLKLKNRQNYTTNEFFKTVSDVYLLLAWVATALAGSELGPAGHVVKFVGIARIVPALRHLAGTLLLHFAAMAKVIVLVHQTETSTLGRRYRRG